MQCTERVIPLIRVKISRSLLWLAFLLCFGLQESNGAKAVHPLYEEELDRAGKLLLAMRLEEGEKLIDGWIKRNPQRPAGYFFKAMALSWRLFLKPRNSDTKELKKEFEKTFQKARRVAEKATTRRETWFEGTLYLGASYGQEALLAMLDRKYLVMAPLAKRAWNLLNEAVGKDPEYQDVCKRCSEVLRSLR